MPNTNQDVDHLTEGALKPPTEMRHIRPNLDTAFTLGRCWSRFAARHEQLAGLLPALVHSPDAVVSFIDTEVKAQLMQINAMFPDLDNLKVTNYIASILTELNLYAIVAAANHPVTTHYTQQRLFSFLEQISTENKPLSTD